MSTLTLTSLVSEFGAYYIPEGQNEARLKQLLRQSAVTPSKAKLVLTDGEQHRSSLSTLDEIIQPFQKTWTSKGTPTFTPKTHQLYNIKIDKDLSPDEIKKSWLAFLASPESEQDRSKWPLVRFVMEKLIVPRMAHDLETAAYYKGIFVAPTTGVAGAASTALQGLRKQLRDARTAGTNNNLAVGSVTASNIFDRIEAMGDQLGDEWEGVPSGIYMEPKYVRWYLRDKRNTHGTDVNYSPDKTVVDFRENLEIIGLPSMAGTGDIFITPKDNLAYFRRINGMSPLRVETAKREVSIFTDWWEGLGFEVDELVWYHDSSDASGS